MKVGECPGPRAVPARSASTAESTPKLSTARIAAQTSSEAAKTISSEAVNNSKPVSSQPAAAPARAALRPVWLN